MVSFQFAVLAILLLLIKGVAADADLSHFRGMRRCFGEPAERFRKRRRVWGLSRMAGSLDHRQGGSIRRRREHRSQT